MPLDKVHLPLTAGIFETPRSKCLFAFIEFVKITYREI